MTEFWRVIRFLDAHNIGFTRSDPRFPYDRGAIYADGHTLRNLAAAYEAEQARKREESAT